MPEITNLSTHDLSAALETNPIGVYQNAADDLAKRGVEETPTVSFVLETLSPRQENNDIDAFTRLLHHNGLRVNSDPAAGIWASRADEFTTSPLKRFLLTELIARVRRDMIFGRATYLAGDNLIGSWAKPYSEATAPRVDPLFAPAIPISEMVAITTPINGDTFRSYYLNYVADNVRSHRVGEAAELPLLKLTDKEHTVKAYKYGFQLQASYEALRRLRVDKLAWHLRLATIQDEADKVEHGLDVIISGDGNSGTAAQVINISTIGGTAGTLDVKSWLRFKMQFKNPYTVTHAMMQEATAIELIFLDTGSTNIPLANLTFAGLQPQNLTPINRTADGVRYGWLDSAPADRIVAYDVRTTLEQFVEVGSQISEMDRFVGNQTQVVTMSEVQGFGILQPGSNKVLNIAS